MGADLYRPGQLPPVVGGFDWTVIDTPPRQAETQRAALMVSDLALLRCGPSASDVWALAESVELARASHCRPPGPHTELSAVFVPLRE